MIYKMIIFKLSFKSMVRQLDFYSVYGLNTSEDLNMKVKKARTFLYFLFLIE